MLAIGGDLSAERLLTAYRQGIFPWFSDGEPVLWWTPEPRAVIRPQHLHVSRRLRRTLRQGQFSYSINECFADVVAACANRPGEGTWITADMAAAYQRLHELGHAHSLEVWRDNELAGGVYGIAIGAVFFGESMFSARRDGSKVALACLTARMLPAGLALIDCQLPSEHLESMGMTTLSRADFEGELRTHCNTALKEPFAPCPPTPSSTLFENTPKTA